MAPVAYANRALPARVASMMDTFDDNSQRTTSDFVVAIMSERSVVVERPIMLEVGKIAAKLCSKKKSTHVRGSLLYLRRSSERWRLQTTGSLMGST